MRGGRIVGEEHEVRATTLGNDWIARTTRSRSACCLAEMGCRLSRLACDARMGGVNGALGSHVARVARVGIRS